MTPDVVILVIAAAFLCFAVMGCLAFALLSTRDDLKTTQEDYAQREASWRLQQNGDRVSRSDVQLVNGMFDEKRVKAIMRERE